VTPPRPTRAFSLIELVIVVVIMGIVAAIAVTRLGDMSTRSKVAATRESVHAIQAVTEEAQAVTGQWPTPLLASMFAGGNWPRNAFLPTQRVSIDEVSTDDTDPPVMATQDVNDGAFWYNRKLGVVRARVPLLSSGAETLALYNAVNGTNATTLATGTGGGSVGGGGGGVLGGTSSLQGTDE
jgi:prepilin-type N-terminal cleavage/methylation domain-containing protein